MIGIVDYGMGNLRSVEKAFATRGFAVKVSDDPAQLAEAGGLVIPGVGGFPDAMKNLHERKLVEPILAHAAAGKPLMGICLGMQILFQEGLEGSRCQGLGLLQGQIVRIPWKVKIPHMGWNRLSILQESPVLKGIADGAFAYFVHSYYADKCDAGDIVAVTDYGSLLPAVVQRGSLFGLQFHPEKSDTAGLAMIKNFGELSQC